jgi:hypothetical protein
MSLDIPLACSLDAGQLEERGREVINPLFQQVKEVVELSDGYSFAFPADKEVVHALMDFIVSERACCPFFTFTLRFEPPHDAVWLSVSGEGEIKAIVRSAFADVVGPEIRLPEADCRPGEAARS